MRITTSMVQRNVLSDLNSLSVQARQDAVQGLLRQGDHAPVATIRSGRRARWACAQNTRRQRAVHAQHRRRAGLAGRDRVRAGLDHRSTSTARRTCCSQGSTDTSDAARASRSPPRSTRSSRASRRRRTPATATSYLMSGTATSTSRRTSSAPTTPTRATRPASTRRSPGVVREIGPGVTMSINSVGREILGDGRAARPTASCSTSCATSPTTCKANDGAALRGGDITKLKAQLDDVLERARPQRRADEPPRGRHHAPGADPAAR